MINHKRAPFDNPRCAARSTSRSTGDAYVKGVRHDGAVVGAALMPPPHGPWGLLDKELARWPAIASPPATRRRRSACSPRPASAPASRCGSRWSRAPRHLRRPRLVRRSTSSARWASRPPSSRSTRPQYFPALARREFQIGANLTASGIDDPDGYLFENFKCGASRNYTDYCDEAMDRLIDAAVAGARSRQAAEAGGGHPAQARGRRRPPDAGLAQGVLHPLAVREEPPPAQLALQLRPHAGGLARQVAHAIRPTNALSGTHLFTTTRSTSTAISPTPRTSATPQPPEHAAPHSQMILSNCWRRWPGGPADVPHAPRHGVNVPGPAARPGGGQRHRHQRHRLAPAAASEPRRLRTGHTAMRTLGQKPTRLAPFRKEYVQNGAGAAPR